MVFLKNRETRLSQTNGNNAKRYLPLESKRNTPFPSKFKGAKCGVAGSLASCYIEKGHGNEKGKGKERHEREREREKEKMNVAYIALKVPKLSCS